MKILVTGGCGFIGSNFIDRCFKKRTNVKIVNVDAMVTGSNKKNIINQKNPNYTFVKGDICNKTLMRKLLKDVDYVINFAAESHVDRSIVNSTNFIRTNIIGVHTILELLREKKSGRLLQISTDEVFGEIIKGSHKEHDELIPSNPYSATKAAAEMLVRSYIKTYDIDAVITRCVNNFGSRQFPEKLIPKTVLCSLKNNPIPIHGTGKSIRQWIYVYDHCDALLQIISKWKRSSIYNIPGTYEGNNLSIVKKILKIMNKSQDLIKYVKERPGQDRRYSLDAKLIKKEIGFKPKFSFQKSLEDTVKWYIKNKEWWKDLAFTKITNPTPWLH